MRFLHSKISQKKKRYLHIYYFFSLVLGLVCLSPILYQLWRQGGKIEIQPHSFPLNLFLNPKQIVVPFRILYKMGWGAIFVILARLVLYVLALMKPINRLNVFSDVFSDVLSGFISFHAIYSKVESVLHDIDKVPQNVWNIMYWCYYVYIFLSISLFIASVLVLFEQDENLPELPE